MNPTTLEVSAGLQNTLSTPREIRDYINERGEGRSFNIESVSVHQEPQPRKIVMHFRITPIGAEQLDPFIVSLVLGDAAASQLAEALSIALVKDERE
jgi:hypothetical protein